MKRKRTMQPIAWLGLLIVTSFGSGCQTSLTTTEAASTQPAYPDAIAIAQASEPGGGARIWAQTCMRCHNLRPPRERSDREWEAITFHMRIRANLTAEEHRRILGFLKAAN